MSLTLTSSLGGAARFLALFRVFIEDTPKSCVHELGAFPAVAQRQETGARGTVHHYTITSCAVMETHIQRAMMLRKGGTLGDTYERAS